ncbi:MAG: UvrD-helicase domain-containing protein, partial [Isosphaeraceae bacterium]
MSAGSNTHANASGITLTVQQRRALGVPDASVALSAGAGCGKTMVLTERFLAALDDGGGRPLEALVALTFTEKAARELRQRIRARCRARLAASGDGSSSAAEAEWWAAVLRGLDAAPIGTFHEFCARLLRRHAMLAGVDPEFAILDQSIGGSLRDEAVRIAIRRRLAERDADLMDLGTDYGLAQVRDALGLLANGRGGVDLEEWAVLEPGAIADRWLSLARERLWPAVRDRARAIAATCSRRLVRLDSDNPRIMERAAAVFEGLGILGPTEPPCSVDRLDELVGLLRVQDLPRAGSWPSQEVYDSVKDAFTELREHLRKEVRPALDWSNNEVLLASAERSLRFARLALGVRREHERLKHRRHGLDFDDLLIKARDLLRDHPEIAAPAEPGDRTPLVEFVLVDEFQDTDGVQGEILRLLSGEAFLTGRLFLVGDIKQSIYRFRGAEPGIFRDWRAAFPARGRLSLTENFRSVPGVIGFVNALFGDCFRDLDPSDADDGESRPMPEDPHRLLPIRGQDTCQPAVEFLWPGSADQEGEDDAQQGERKARPSTPKLTAHERRMIEARCIARRLRERLDAGWPVLDRASGQIRLAHAGDVALLFRAMTDLWPYESALADEGFDYHTIGGSAFYAQQEVHDVINLLSVVEDPFDEVALAGALRSPFFGVSDEGLFRLSTAREREGGITAGVYWLDVVPGLSSLDRARAARAVELLARWRADKDCIPMAELVARMLDESGFEAAVVCEFLGDRKLANTRKVVRLARDFDRQGGFTLADFVARLRADLEDEPKEEQAATTDEEGASIRLMSIHQAKGLEFPIVVLPDVGRTSRGQSPLVACRPDLGLVVRPPLPMPQAPDGTSGGEAGENDPVWRAYLTLERLDEEQESLRLFYVAATRARDALILSAGLEPGESVPSNAVAMRLLDERFDRATGACRVPHNPADPGPRPDVRVHRMPPPPPREERTPDRGASAAPSTPRLSITAIAETIEGAGPPASSGEETTRPCGVPGYLELDPAARAASRATRLDGLVRAIVRDARWRRPDPPAMGALA